MGSDPPDLGKGLFGYRKSAVNQIIADRDIMLRQAEGRVRAAEAKVAELEGKLSSFKERNARMDEQLDRLRSQLDVVLKRTESGGPAADTEGLPEAETAAAQGQTDYEEGVAAGHGFPAGARFTPEDFGYESAEQPTVPAPEPEPQHQTYGWSAADETAATVGEPTMDPQTATPPEDLPAWARPEPPRTDQPEPDWHPGETTETSAQQGGPFEAEPAWMMRLSEQRRPALLAEDEAAWTAETAPGQEAAGPATDAPFQASPTPPEQPAVPEGTHEPTPAYPPQPAQSWPEPQPVPPVAAYEQEPRMPEPPPETYAQPEPEWIPAPPPPEPSAYHAPPPAGDETRLPERDDMASRFLTEELAGILSAAEESAARIVERARANTQRQITESNRLWREVQAEVARFASWRDQVEPVIRQVQSKVDSVRGMVEEVPERIRQALAPMADAISSIDADMAELGSALTPPLLLTPGGLEGEGQSWLSRAAQTNPDFERPAEESPDAGGRPYEGGSDTPGPFGAEAG